MKIIIVKMGINYNLSLLIKFTVSEDKKQSTMEKEIISFDEASQIFSLVENSSFYELVLITLILLPLYLGSWIYILNQYNIKGKKRPLILSSLMIVYVAGVFLYKVGYEDRLKDTEVQLESKYNFAKSKIINFLNYTEPGIKDSIWEIVGFNETKRKIDSRYTDEFLESLIDRYPEVFQRIQLHSKDDPKGLKYKRSNLNN